MKTVRQRSVMWDYIAQEPAILRELMASDQTARFSAQAGGELEAVYFVAHGSSYNAALSISGFMARAAKLRVYVYTPANFLDCVQVLRQEKRALAVAISQTGTSSGVIEALRKARELGARTLGITANPASPLAGEADHALLLGCGEENSNAKTKGYMSTLTLLLLLAVHLGETRGALSGREGARIRRELEGQIAQMDGVAEAVKRWCEENRFGAALRALYVLGYDMNFGTALEGQLKLMETMCIPTMFNDLGEFSHGMHRAIGRESTVMLLRAAHPLQRLSEDAFRYLQGVAGTVLLLDAAGDAPAEPGRLVLPAYPMTQSLLLLTLAIQIFSVSAPEQNGLDPNRDANNSFTEVAHTRI